MGSLDSMGASGGILLMRSNRLGLVGTDRPVYSFGCLL